MYTVCFQFTNGVCRYSTTSTPTPRRKLSDRNDPDVLDKLWQSLRSNNGIMVLLKLLLVKTPITEADAIRAMACRVRSDKI